MGETIKILVLICVIPFVKLPHLCLNFRKKITNFMDNMQTGECHPYVSGQFQAHSCFSCSVNCGAATRENGFQVTVLNL